MGWTLGEHPFWLKRISPFNTLCNLCYILWCWFWSRPPSPLSPFLIRTSRISQPSWIGYSGQRILRPNILFRYCKWKLKWNVFSKRVYVVISRFFVTLSLCGHSAALWRDDWHLKVRQSKTPFIWQNMLLQLAVFLPNRCWCPMATEYRTAAKPISLEHVSDGQGIVVPPWEMSLEVSHILKKVGQKMQVNYFLQLKGHIDSPPPPLQFILYEGCIFWSHALFFASFPWAL